MISQLTTEPASTAVGVTIGNPFLTNIPSAHVPTDLKTVLR